MLASSPGHSHLFNVTRRKRRGPGIRCHVINVTRIKGGWRVKLSVGDIQDGQVAATAQQRANRQARLNTTSSLQARICQRSLLHWRCLTVSFCVAQMQIKYCLCTSKQLQLYQPSVWMTHLLDNLEHDYIWYQEYIIKREGEYPTALQTPADN